MVKDDSNKSESMTIAGILITISIIAIFVAFAMGVMGSNAFSDKGVQAANTGTPSTLENIPENISENILKTSPGCGDVPVDQCLCDEDHTVKPGEIEIFSDNIPDELPICISPKWGEDKWVVIRVKGGYTPDDPFGMLKIKQYGVLAGNPCNNMWVGWRLQVDDSWVECPEEGDCVCKGCWVYYNISFDTTCDNWVCLDSTDEPGGDNSDPWDCKLVDLCYKTNWLGCHFDYILAHKNHIPGILNSRINI